MDDDGEDKDDTKRRTRNLSEKKRRDEFNTLVTEMSTLITSSCKKMDKSTILKSTISFLKNHNEVKVRSRAHDVQEDWKPAFLSNEEFHYLVLEALEGFMMVLSTDGRVYYVSETITSLLGHNPGDVVNKTIFDLTFEEDQANLFNLLQTNASAAENMNPSKENEMIRFQIHLRRGILDFREEVSYDLVQFYGHFRAYQELLDDNCEFMNYQQDPDPRLLFVCIGRLHTPQLIRDVSLVDPTRSEFTSRHSLEWKFLFLDHRAPPIIGYLPFEVLGTSGYDYYHFDDLEKVVTCHEALMQKGELTSCFYRFLTKGQQWIWLQTRYYITYHQWNSKPEFVVCTHRVVSYADVAKVAKEEFVKQDLDVSESEDNPAAMKEAPDVVMAPISPSFTTGAAREAYHDSYNPIPQGVMKRLIPSVVIPLSPSYSAITANDGFGNTFQMVSQETLKIPTPNTARLSPSYIPGRSGSFANAYPPDSQNMLRTPPPPAAKPCMSLIMSERSDSFANSFPPITQNYIERPPSDEAVATVTPIYVSEAENSYGNFYHRYPKPSSVKSASALRTVGTMAAATPDVIRSRPHTRYAATDTGSVSGDSRSSLRNSEREPPKPVVSLVPQHGIGTQFLEQQYGVVQVRSMMPDATMQDDVSSDHAQMQGQLQRKHEELQQMIVHQQEELRQVKEQLLLARLGILQPLMNVPSQYPTPEDVQNQLAYLNPPRPAIGYPHVAMRPMQPLPQISVQAPHPPHPLHPTHPSHPSHPPHHSDQHQHMP